MDKEAQALSARYVALLGHYLRHSEEHPPSALRALGAEFVRCHIGPGAVAAMHERALAEHLPTLASTQVMDAALRSMRFLREALAGFGEDLLQPYIEATVTNRFVGRILRDLESEFHIPEVARMRMGRKYADNFEGDLANYLDTFRLQGLGFLELESVDEERGEVVFTGRDIFESEERCDYPQDHFTRGFLARAVSVLTQRPMNCEEVACEAKGAPRCRFVVSPVVPGPIPNLRRLLQG
ncbi:MAG: phosphatase RsbU N-terminal domain-containing protein [Armatimonadota bacterium]|nr:phosphatase RsbU N-terminal domain-containing protein [Armatimonadota bacterium]